MLGGDVVTRICKRRQENKLESALTDQYKNDGPGQDKGDTMDWFIYHAPGSGIQQEVGKSPGLCFYHSGQEETKRWGREGDSSGAYGIMLSFGDGDELCPVKDIAQNSGRLEC